MTIFNSYVKLPEGNHGKCAKIIENDHWGYPCMTIPPKFVDQNAKKKGWTTTTQRHGWIRCFNTWDHHGQMGKFIDWNKDETVRCWAQVYAHFWILLEYDSVWPILYELIKSPVFIWLVVSNIGGFKHFSILRIIIPSDELIFFRGVGIPPTSHGWKDLNCVVSSHRNCVITDVNVGQYRDDSPDTGFVVACLNVSHWSSSK